MSMPRRTRRSVALPWLVLALMVFLTACGGEAAAPTTAATTTTTTTTARVGGQATTTTTVTTARTTTTTVPAPATTARATTTAGTTARPAAATPTRTGTVAGSPTRPAAGATPNTAIRITGPFPGETNTLNGSGATFPQVLYSRWFDEYANLTQVRVNYQGTGSGAGKNAIRDGTADFAGSDSPMSQQELDAARGRCGENILHIPTTLGAIVLAYNIPGLPATPALRMDGDIIANIYLGQITRWNDQRIASQNPGVNLPNEEILVVRRSDSSGTTDNFTNYLTNINQQWRSGPGRGTTVNWPVGIGGQGNQGVAGEIRNNPYAIGYVELAFAKQSNLPFANVRNQAGQYITPSAASVTAAGEAQAPTLPPDLRDYITNAPGAESYPITAITWILVCPRQTDQAKAIALTRMLWWALHEGQRFNEQLDYAPLPPSVVVRGEEFINQITVNGQRAFPGR